MTNKTILLLALVVCLSVQQNPSDTPNFQQQELSMRRTACLVLSRYHSNTQKENIEGVVAELPVELQQKYINKMYATAVEHCLPSITMDDAQKFFIEDPSFSPVQMFHLYDNFDYTEAAKQPNSLTKNQENLIKFIKNFDQQMAVRKEEREASAQEEEGEDKFDMKFFGFSKDEVPSALKYVYITIFAVAIIGVITYLMSKLDDSKSSKSPLKKKKSSPSKSASPSKAGKKE